MMAMNDLEILMKTVASIAMGISLLIVVYGAYKYTASGGERHTLESAKRQIISGVVGGVIAMPGIVIATILTGASHSIKTPIKTSPIPHTSHSYIGFILVAILAVATIIGILFSVVKGRSEKEMKPIQTNNVVQDAPKKEKTREKMHSKWFEEVKEQYTITKNKVKEVEERAEELDVEQKHRIGIVFKNDIENLWESFGNLNDLLQERDADKVIESFQKINEELGKVKEYLEKKDEFQLEKTIRLIEKHTD